ncbi:MAG: hypothetical protein ACTS4U_00585 [Candidatus Hodgkinia cicadicola]
MRLVKAAEVSAAEGCNRLTPKVDERDAQLLKWVDSWSLGVLDWLRPSPGGFGFQGTKRWDLGEKWMNWGWNLAQSAINCRA